LFTQRQNNDIHTIESTFYFHRPAHGSGNTQTKVVAGNLQCTGLTGPYFRKSSTFSFSVFSTYFSLAVKFTKNSPLLNITQFSTAV